MMCEPTRRSLRELGFSEFLNNASVHWILWNKIITLLKGMKFPVGQPIITRSMVLKEMCWQSMIDDGLVFVPFDSLSNGCILCTIFHSWGHLDNCGWCPLTECFLATSEYWKFNESLECGDLDKAIEYAELIRDCVCDKA